MNIYKFIYITVFSLLISVFSSGASYAMPCYVGGVSGSVGCQDGVDNNDFLSIPITVNQEEFFGYDDWMYIDRFNVGEGLDTNSEYNWTVTPDEGWPDSTGTWSFGDAVWEDFKDVMLIIKDGKVDDIFFSGYLLDNIGRPASGTWDVGNDRELSHLTLYVRGEGTPPVPEPATVILLGSGVIGLFAYRRIINRQ